MDGNVSILEQAYVRVDAKQGDKPCYGQPLDTLAITH
jgi:hypothetical protein